MRDDDGRRPVKVVDGEAWGWMRDEGIWGAAEKLRESEGPEVRRRMLEWFGHKVVWGAAEKLRKSEGPEVRRRMLECFGHQVVWPADMKGTRWGEVREGTRKFERVDGGVCQYGGIVRDAVAAMMVAGPVEVVDGEV